MVQQLAQLLAVHIFKPPTSSKIFGLRRVKAKTLIKVDNNNQTAPDKGACEALKLYQSSHSQRANFCFLVVRLRPTAVVRI